MKPQPSHSYDDGSTVVGEHRAMRRTRFIVDADFRPPSSEQRTAGNGKTPLRSHAEAPADPRPSPVGISVEAIRRCTEDKHVP